MSDTKKDIPNDQGVYHGLPFESYQQIDAVNHSALQHMDTSPESFMVAIEGERGDTSAFAFGRAVHTAVLEPELFDSMYESYTGKVRRGAAWEAFKEDHGAKEILTATEKDNLDSVVNSVFANEKAADIIENSSKEVTLIWVDEKTGIKCKCRLDIVGYVIGDLKTTSAKTEGDFVGAAHKYMYHSQMAFYARGCDAHGIDYSAVKIIAAQKVDLKKTFIVNVPDETLNAGDKLVTKWLDNVKECRESGEWPGLGDDEVEFILPPYALIDDEPLDLIIGGESVVM